MEVRYQVVTWPRFFFLIRGNFPPILCMQWTSLFCLNMCIWYLAISICILVLHRKKTGSLPAEQKGCVQSIALCQLSGGTRWPWETDTYSRCWSRSVWSLFFWENHCSYQWLYVESSMATPNLQKMLQTGYKGSYFWWLAWLYSLPSFTCWKSSLGISNWIFLLHSTFNGERLNNLSLRLRKSQWCQLSPFLFNTYHRF